MTQRAVGRAGARSSDPGTDVPRPDGRPLVVVCDDDPEVTSLVAQALEEDGFATAELHDGRAAVEACGAPGPRGPDLVITDHRMPGWNGLQVLAALRRTGASVPLILVTAFGDERVHAEARRLGAVAVFDKPFDLDLLRAAVRDLLGGSMEVGRE